MILLIITGSIACYKSLDLIRLFVQNDILFEVILTDGAANFVTPGLVSAISGKKCHTEDSWAMEHISLSKAECIVVAPASANFIGHAANGLGGSLGLDTLLARPVTTPLVIAPAMNTRMLANPLVQANLAKLSQNGAVVMDTAWGELACMETGNGKMAGVNEIYDFAIRGANNPVLKSKKIIITGGAGREDIDDVRYLSNHSSGMQAYLIARELFYHGADVFYIGNCNPNYDLSFLGNQYIQAYSAEEMLSAISVITNDLTSIDVFISCAAVCDFTFNKFDGKMPKSKEIQLQPIKNTDILQTISTEPNHQRPKMCIGFSAENNINHQAPSEISRTKINEKNLDYLVCNDIASGKAFGDSEIDSIIFSRKGEVLFKSKSKKDVAKNILDLLKRPL